MIDMEVLTNRVRKSKNVPPMKPFPLSSKNGPAFFNGNACLIHAQEHAHEAKVSLTEQNVQFVNELIGFISRSYNNLPVEKIVSKSRGYLLCQARFLFVYAVREKLDLSQEIMGGFLGGRDHSTISNAERRHGEIMSNGRDSFYDHYRTVAEELAVWLKSINLDMVPLTPKEKRREDLRRFAFLLGHIDVEQQIDKHLENNGE